MIHNADPFDDEKVTKQWMLQDYRHGVADQAGKPQDQKVNANFYSGAMYNGLVASDALVEDGSYVKLRELSVSYTFGQKMLASTGLGRITNGVKLALIGRNLYTWTKYTGFDPEVTAGNDLTSESTASAIQTSALSPARSSSASEFDPTWDQNSYESN